ncbi:MAG: hypothetical protein HFH62_03070 [Lachnospiraceae bacterium]|nr:hypothetical protein [Lachnospiraceae bacterium]
MKIWKRRWVKIVGILLVVALTACFVASGLFYWRVKHSILGEIGIDYVFRVEKIRMTQYSAYCMAQDPGFRNGCLNQRDRKKLFMILSHTRKYDKNKDRPYLLDGRFLEGPDISFERENYQLGERGDWINWDYLESTFVYYYPEQKRGEELKHGRKYYLEKKYAQELKALFE